MDEEIKEGAEQESPEAVSPEPVAEPEATPEAEPVAESEGVAEEGEVVV